MKDIVLKFEISNDIINLQKQNYLSSKNNFLTTGFICIILFLMSLIFGSFLVFGIFIISLIDLRKKSINYTFQKAMLVSLASESITHTIDSIL